MTTVTTMTEAWPDGDGLQLGRGQENRMTEAWPDGGGLHLGRGPENRMMRIMMTMNDEDTEGQRTMTMAV